MRRIKTDKSQRVSRQGRVLSIAMSVTFVTAVAVLAMVPAAFPGLGAKMADVLRSVIGIEPVAILESASFKVHDQINRLMYSGGKPSPQINFSDLKPVTTVTPFPTDTPALASPNPTLVAADTINVITAMPQIGWLAYGPDVNGQPGMARAIIMMDPQRSYTAVALVRIDLTQLQLHMMTGTVDPVSSSVALQGIPEVGMVPLRDQNALIATFNGGFKGEHGHYGIMVNGITLLQPLPGMATVAIYKDGQVRIGTWGKEINPSTDMTSFRQNCPPLIEAGQVNPALSLDNRTAWGYSNNSDITWRTGLGISQDNRYLIYAVGNGTSAKTLAESLQTAGAYNAMQLDINEYYAHFYTYQPVNPAVSQGFKLYGSPLLEQMTVNPYIYLAPNPRDFFYLTTG